MDGHLSEKNLRLRPRNLCWSVALLLIYLMCFCVVVYVVVVVVVSFVVLIHVVSSVLLLNCLVDVAVRRLLPSLNS